MVVVVVVEGWGGLCLLSGARGARAEADSWRFFKMGSRKVLHSEEASEDTSHRWRPSSVWNVSVLVKRSLSLRLLPRQ